MFHAKLCKSSSGDSMRTRKSPGSRTLRNARVPMPGIVVVRHMISFPLTYHPVFSILSSSIAVNKQPGGISKVSLFFPTMNTFRQAAQEGCRLAGIVVVTQVHNFYDLRARRDKVRATTTRIVGHVERVLTPMFLHLSNRITFSMDSVDAMVINNPVASRVARLKAVWCLVERTRHNPSRHSINDHAPHVSTVTTGLRRLIPSGPNVLSHLERISRCSRVIHSDHARIFRAKSEKPPVSFSRPGMFFFR
nr:MAG TPA: hypothetical protein [Caudoviricetes sp.]